MRGISRKVFFAKDMKIKLNILNLVTDEKCYEYLRLVRWQHGLVCSHCGSQSTVKNGISNHNMNIHRYESQECEKGFNDLTATVFSDSKKPLKV